MSKIKSSQISETIIADTGTFSGAVTADSFSGDGSSLTGVSAGSDFAVSFLSTTQFKVIAGSMFANNKLYKIPADLTITADVSSDIDFFCYLDLDTASESPAGSVVVADIAILSTDRDSTNLHRYIPLGQYNVSGGAVQAGATFISYPNKYYAHGNASLLNQTEVNSVEYTTTGTKTFTHNHSGLPNQLEIMYFNGTTTGPLDLESFVTDVTATEVKLDLTGLAFGSGETVTLKTFYVQDSKDLVALAATEFDSGLVTSAATTVFTHNFTKIPIGISILYDDAGTEFYLDSTSHVVSVTDTSLTIDWGSLTLDSTHTARVHLSSHVKPTGMPVHELLAEKFVGTIGRSDYPDLDSTAGKTIVSGDLDNTAGVYGWNFSGTNTATVTNFIGGQDLTVGAGALTTDTDATGVSGRQVGFNGSTYLTTSSVDMGVGDFSVSMWAYKADWTPTVSEVLISQQTDQTFFVGWFIRLTADLLSFTVGGVGNVGSFRHDTLAPGWHHFAVTRSPDRDEINFYVDSRLVSNTVDNPSTLSTEPMRVGTRRDTGGNFGQFWDGNIDEVVTQAGVVWDIHQVRRLYYSSELSSHHGGAGHTLTTSSFDRTISSNQISFWNLEVDGNDDSVNSNDLTDGAGSSVVYTGNSFDGTANAAVFDGSVDFLEDVTANFDYAGSFTAGVWAIATQETDETFIGKYDVNANKRSFYLGYNVSNDVYNFGISVDGTFNAATELSVPAEPSKWLFIVGKFDQALNTMSVYINGVLRGSITNPTLTAVNVDATTNLRVGSLANAGAILNPIEGTLSNAFYCKYALTDTEIQKLYSLKAGHFIGTNIFDMNMLGKVTLESGLTTKTDFSNFERASDSTDVYVDVSDLSAGDKISTKLK